MIGSVTQKAVSVGLSGVAGVLPPRLQPRELAAAGLLSSSPQTLAALGFERAHICDADYRPEEMALDAARAALNDAGLGSHEIDAVIWASARSETHILRRRRRHRRVSPA